MLGALRYTKHAVFNFRPLVLREFHRKYHKIHENINPSFNTFQTRNHYTSFKLHVNIIQVESWQPNKVNNCHHHCNLIWHVLQLNSISSSEVSSASFPLVSSSSTTSLATTGLSNHSGVIMQLEDFHSSPSVGLGYSAGQHQHTSRWQSDSSLICADSVFLHGAKWLRSIFESMFMVPSGPPHFSHRRTYQSASPLLCVLPYLAQVNSSKSSTNLSERSHISPNWERASINWGDFCRSVIGHTFPLTLNALVVSQWVENILDEWWQQVKTGWCYLSCKEFRYLCTKTREQKSDGTCSGSLSLVGDWRWQICQRNRNSKLVL